VSGHDDFEVEAEPGLPAPLPAGEARLWSGAPDWQALARYAFHVRKVGVYFGLLGGWYLVEGLHDGTPLAILLPTLGVVAGWAALACGVLALLAWGSAREAVYTLTSERLVLRFGIALRITFNVPFRILAGVSLKKHSDGTGDIALALGGTDRVSYVVLWPHARPWRFRNPEITLRCIRNPERVAEQLTDAINIAGAGMAPQRPRVAAQAGDPSGIAIEALAR
jgi:hypothetical protein